MRPWLTLIFVLVVVLYAVLGGVIFHFIEQGYETQLKTQALQQINVYVSNNGNQSSCLNMTDIILLNNILQELSNGGYYIDPLSGSLVNSTKWDIRTAIFGAISVLTTVGFRVVAPDYTGGRVFCIIYGLLGIPLFYSICVAVGKVWEKAISVMGYSCFSRIFQPILCHIVSQILAFAIGFTLLMLIPAVIFSSLEQWSYGISLYFCFCTMFTIGFGDYIPGYNHALQTSDNYLNWYHLAVGFWILILISWYLANLYILVNKIYTAIVKTDDDINARWYNNIFTNTKLKTDESNKERPQIYQYNNN